MALNLVDTTKILLDRFAQGDPTPLDSLLERAGHRIMGLISMKMSESLKRRMGPEDVLQEVYIEAMRQIPTFENRGPAQFYAWFAALAANKISNLEQAARAGKRDARKEVHLNSSGGTGTTAHVQAGGVQAAQTSPSGVVIRWETYETIGKALESLPPLERQVVLHRYFEGLTSQETADRLGVRISQVYVALSRGLSRVRSLLGAL